MPTITRDQASAALTALQRAAGADGRLSRDDLSRANAEASSDAQVTQELGDFLRATSRKQGLSQVVMKNPLGTGKVSNDEVVDAFLESLEPVATRTQGKSPTLEEIKDWVDGLTHFAGDDGRLGKAEIEKAVERSPFDAEIVTALIDFLTARAKAAGRTYVSMKAPLGDGPASASDIRAGFIKYLATQPPVPRHGDTRRVGKQEETFQFGQWLPFKYEPAYGFSASGKVMVRHLKSAQFHLANPGDPGLPWVTEKTLKKLAPQRKWELDSKNRLALEALRARATTVFRQEKMARLAEFEATDLVDNNDDDRRTPTGTRRRTSSFSLVRKAEALFESDRSPTPRVNVSDRTVHRFDLFEPRVVDRTIHRFDLPVPRVVDRTIHRIDLPFRRDVDPTVPRRDTDLVSRWISDVDRRWNIATNNNTFGRRDNRNRFSWV